MSGLEVADEAEEQANAGSDQDEKKYGGDEEKVFESNAAAVHVTKLRGEASIYFQNNSVCTDAIDSFPTFQIKRALDPQKGGSFYYEVELLSSGLHQIGWATNKLQTSSSNGVGDDENSWAYDGQRLKKWHSGRGGRADYGERWQTHDVISCGLNLKSKTCEFYRNGKSLGIAFEDMKIGALIYAAFTSSEGEALRIIPAKEFKHHKDEIRQKYPEAINVCVPADVKKNKISWNKDVGEKGAFKLCLLEGENPKMTLKTNGLFADCKATTNCVLIGNFNIAMTGGGKHRYALNLKQMNNEDIATANKNGFGWACIEDDKITDSWMIRNGELYRFNEKSKKNEKVVEEAQSFKNKPFVYVSDLDENGICYALGSNFGRRYWVNAAHLNLIKVSSSPLQSGCQHISHVLGREAAHCVCEETEEAFVQINFGSLQIRATHYTLRHDSSSNNEALRNWKLEGSNDGISWTLLKEHKNDESLQEKGQSHTWTIKDSKQSFSKFRITLTGPNSSTHDILACGGFEIYGDLSGTFDFETLSRSFIRDAIVGKEDGLLIPAPDIKDNSDEDAKVEDWKQQEMPKGIVFKLGTRFDDEQEWLNPAKLGLINVSASTLMYNSEAVEHVVGREFCRVITKDERNSFIQIDFISLRIRPTAYTFRHYSSYDDNALRNWKLEGSKDGKSWQEIKDHGNDDKLKKRGQFHTWTVPEQTDSFRMFRIMVTGPGADDDFFVPCSGFEIFGSVTYEQTKFVDRWQTGDKFECLLDTKQGVVKYRKQKKGSFLTQTLGSEAATLSNLTPIFYIAEKSEVTIRTESQSIPNINEFDGYRALNVLSALREETEANLKVVDTTFPVKVLQEKGTIVLNKDNKKEIICSSDSSFGTYFCCTFSISSRFYFEAIADSKGSFEFGIIPPSAIAQNQGSNLKNAASSKKGRGSNIHSHFKGCAIDVGSSEDDESNRYGICIDVKNHTISIYQKEKRRNTSSFECKDDDSVFPIFLLKSMQLRLVFDKSEMIHFDELLHGQPIDIITTKYKDCMDHMYYDTDGSDSKPVKEVIGEIIQSIEDRCIQCTARKPALIVSNFKLKTDDTGNIAQNFYYEVRLTNWQMKQVWIGFMDSADLKQRLQDIEYYLSSTNCFLFNLDEKRICGRNLSETYPINLPQWKETSVIGVGIKKNNICFYLDGHDLGRAFTDCHKSLQEQLVPAIVLPKDAKLSIVFDKDRMVDVPKCHYPINVMQTFYTETRSEQAWIIEQESELYPVRYALALSVNQFERSNDNHQGRVYYQCVAEMAGRAPKSTGWTALSTSQSVLPWNLPFVFGDVKFNHYPKIAMVRDDGRGDHYMPMDEIVVAQFHEENFTDKQAIKLYLRVDRMFDIEQIDDALSRYYRQRDQEYEHQFLQTCRRHQINGNNIQKEMHKEATECRLTSFDFDFPWNSEQIDGKDRKLEENKESETKTNETDYHANDNKKDEKEKQQEEQKKVEEQMVVDKIVEFKQDDENSTNGLQNGICYALATNFDRADWVNPAQSKFVQLRSSLWHPRAVPIWNVVGKEAKLAITEQDEHAFISIDFLSLSIKPTHYALRHIDISSNYLRSWNLEASNDGKSWTVIKKHANDEALTRYGSCASWEIEDCQQSYRMFKLAMTGMNSSEQRYLACSGFEIYGTLNGKFKYNPFDKKKFQQFVHSQLKHIIEKETEPISVVSGRGKVLGQSGGYHITAESLFVTFRINQSLAANGRFYYQVKLEDGGFAQIGFGDDKCKASDARNEGCGDDAHSWAYEGYKSHKWHKGTIGEYGKGKEWRRGDTVTCCMDMKQKQCEFYLNGEPLGVAFPKMEISGNIYPYMSLSRGVSIQVLLHQSQLVPIKFSENHQAILSPRCLGVLSADVGYQRLPPAVGQCILCKHGIQRFTFNDTETARLQCSKCYHEPKTFAPFQEEKARFANKMKSVQRKNYVNHYRYSCGVCKNYHVCSDCYVDDQISWLKIYEYLRIKPVVERQKLWIQLTSILKSDFVQKEDFEKFCYHLIMPIRKAVKQEIHFMLDWHAIKEVLKIRAAVDILYDGKQRIERDDFVHDFRSIFLGLYETTSDTKKQLQDFVVDRNGHQLELKQLKVSKERACCVCAEIRKPHLSHSFMSKEEQEADGKARPFWVSRKDDKFVLCYPHGSNLGEGYGGAIQQTKAFIESAFDLIKWFHAMIPKLDDAMYEMALIPKLKKDAAKAASSDRSNRVAEDEELDDYEFTSAEIKYVFEKLLEREKVPVNSGDQKKMTVYIESNGINSVRMREMTEGGFIDQLVAQCDSVDMDFYTGMIIRKFCHDFYNNIAKTVTLLISTKEKSQPVAQSDKAAVPEEEKKADANADHADAADEEVKSEDAKSEDAKVEKIDAATLNAAIEVSDILGRRLLCQDDKAEDGHNFHNLDALIKALDQCTPFEPQTQENAKSDNDKKQSPNCPQNHGLSETVCTGSCRCGVCREQIPTDSKMYSCRDCNYNACVKCFNGPPPVEEFLKLFKAHCKYLQTFVQKHVSTKTTVREFLKQNIPKVLESYYWTFQLKSDRVGNTFDTQIGANSEPPLMEGVADSYIWAKMGDFLRNCRKDYKQLIARKELNLRHDEYDKPLIMNEEKQELLTLFKGFARAFFRYEPWQWNAKKKEEYEKQIDEHMQGVVQLINDQYQAGAENRAFNMTISSFVNDENFCNAFVSYQEEWNANGNNKNPDTSTAASDQLHAAQPTDDRRIEFTEDKQEEEEAGDAITTMVPTQVEQQNSTEEKEAAGHEEKETVDETTTAVQTHVELQRHRQLPEFEATEEATDREQEKEDKSPEIEQDPEKKDMYKLSHYSIFSHKNALQNNEDYFNYLQIKRDVDLEKCLKDTTGITFRVSGWNANSTITIKVEQTMKGCQTANTANISVSNNNWYSIRIDGNKLKINGVTALPISEHVDVKKLESLCIGIAIGTEVGDKHFVISSRYFELNILKDWRLSNPTVHGKSDDHVLLIDNIKPNRVHWFSNLKTYIIDLFKHADIQGVDGKKPAKKEEKDNGEPSKKDEKKNGVDVTCLCYSTFPSCTTSVEIRSAYFVPPEILKKSLNVDFSMTSILGREFIVTQQTTFARIQIHRAIYNMLRADDELKPIREFLRIHVPEDNKQKSGKIVVDEEESKSENIILSVSESEREGESKSIPDEKKDDHITLIDDKTEEEGPGEEQEEQAEIEAVSGPYLPNAGGCLSWNRQSNATEFTFNELREINVQLHNYCIQPQQKSSKSRELRKLSASPIWPCVAIKISRKDVVAATAEKETHLLRSIFSIDTAVWSQNSLPLLPLSKMVANEKQPTLLQHAYYFEMKLRQISDDITNSVSVGFANHDIQEFSSTSIPGRALNTVGLDGANGELSVSATYSKSIHPIPFRKKQVIGCCVLIDDKLRRSQINLSIMGEDSQALLPPYPEDKKSSLFPGEQAHSLFAFCSIGSKNTEIALNFGPEFENKDMRHSICQGIFGADAIEIEDTGKADLEEIETVIDRIEVKTNEEQDELNTLKKAIPSLRIDLARMTDIVLELQIADETLQLQNNQVVLNDREYALKAVFLKAQLYCVMFCDEFARFDAEKMQRVSLLMQLNQCADKKIRFSKDPVFAKVLEAKQSMKRPANSELFSILDRYDKALQVVNESVEWIEDDDIININEEYAPKPIVFLGQKRAQNELVSLWKMVSTDRVANIDEMSAAAKKQEFLLDILAFYLSKDKAEQILKELIQKWSIGLDMTARQAADFMYDYELRILLDGLIRGAKNPVSAAVQCAIYLQEYSKKFPSIEEEVRQLSRYCEQAGVTFLSQIQSTRLRIICLEAHNTLELALLHQLETFVCSAEVQYLKQIIWISRADTLMINAQKTEKFRDEKGELSQWTESLFGDYVRLFRSWANMKRFLFTDEVSREWFYSPVGQMQMETIMIIVHIALIVYTASRLQSLYAVTSMSVMEFIFHIFNLNFIIAELNQAFVYKSRYLRDSLNWFDITSIIGFIGVFVLRVFVVRDVWTCDSDDLCLDTWENALYLSVWFIVIMSSCIKLCYTLFVFKAMGLLVRSMISMLVDVSNFIIFIGIFVLGFATILLMATGPQDGFSTWNESMMSMLYGMLDGLDYTEFYNVYLNEWRNVLINSIVLVYVVLAVIILLNFIIAVMSTTYEGLNEQAEIFVNFHRTKVLYSKYRLPALPPPFQFLPFCGKILLNLYQCCTPVVDLRQYVPKHGVKENDSYMTKQKVGKTDEYVYKYKMTKDSLIAIDHHDDAADSPKKYKYWTCNFCCLPNLIHENGLLPKETDLSRLTEQNAKNPPDFSFNDEDLRFLHAMDINLCDNCYRVQHECKSDILESLISFWIYHSLSFLLIKLPLIVICVCIVLPVVVLCCIFFCPLMCCVCWYELFDHCSCYGGSDVCQSMIDAFADCVDLQSSVESLGNWFQRSQNNGYEVKLMNVKQLWQQYKKEKTPRNDDAEPSMSRNDDAEIGSQPTTQTHADEFTAGHNDIDSDRNEKLEKDFVKHFIASLLQTWRVFDLAGYGKQILPKIVQRCEELLEIQITENKFEPLLLAKNVGWETASEFSDVFSMELRHRRYHGRIEVDGDQVPYRTDGLPKPHLQCVIEPTRYSLSFDDVTSTELAVSSSTAFEQTRTDYRFTNTSVVQCIQRK